MIPSISQTPSNTPSNTATVTPSLTACPVTPSSTVTPTRTPSLTPTQSPFAVCPEELTIVSTNNPNWSTGTYNRKYDYSGGTLLYGYYSTTLGYSVGTAPDGNNYPIFKSASDFDFLVRLFIGGTDFGFAQMASTGDGWNGPVSGGTINQAQFYNYITISGARFPATGLQTANSYNHYLAYPAVCPTTTPTNTLTRTPTMTPTITVTPTISSTPTNTPTPSATSVIFDPDAAAYLAEVLSQGGTGITSTVSAATNTMFVSLKSAGLYSKIQALYPYIGGIANSHRVNAVNIGTYTITWSGTITHNSQGVRGDGAGGKGSTGWIQNTATTAGNTTIGTYIVASGNTGWDMGTFTGSNFLGFNVNGSGGAAWVARMGTSSNVVLASTNRENGFYAATRTGTTQINFIRFSGTPSSVSSTESALMTNGMDLLWLNNSGFYSTKTYGTHLMGTGMNNTELTDLRNIITTFNNAIGR